MDGANGQTGGKNRSSTFVLTAFISFGLLNIFQKRSFYERHSMCRIRTENRVVLGNRVKCSQGAPDPIPRTALSKVLTQCKDLIEF
jgi:hypothetical protein